LRPGLYEQIRTRGDTLQISKMRMLQYGGARRGKRLVIWAGDLICEVNNHNDDDKFHGLMDRSLTNSQVAIGLCFRVGAAAV
jgi:hypothetical protein